MELYGNSHQFGLETGMLSLEMKSLLVPGSFAAHSSPRPGPMGCPSWCVPGGGFLLPMKSEGQCEGCNPLLAWREAGASWRSSSLQPSLRLRPPGGLWEPGLCLKPRASPGDVGKRTVGAHTACGRLHSAHTPRTTDSVALLACRLSEHSTFSRGS